MSTPEEVQTMMEAILQAKPKPKRDPEDNPAPAPKKMKRSARPKVETKKPKVEYKPIPFSRPAGIRPLDCAHNREMQRRERLNSTSPPSSNGSPPVCERMTYGEYKRQLERMEKRIGIATKVVNSMSKKRNKRR